MIFYRYGTRHLPQFIITILLSLLLPLIANAGILSLPRNGTATTYHSLQGQPGVIRVSLKGMLQFVVVKTGDRHGEAGELHRIKLHLVNTTPGTTEYFDHKWGSMEMYNQTRGKRGRSAYVTAHKNDIINTIDRRPLELFIFAHPGDHILLEVTARELDCTGQRVCGRGDNSYYSIALIVPNFSSGQITSTCTRRNTKVLVQLPDGRFRFDLIAANPVSERGSLRIYPVKGTLCYTGQFSTTIPQITRPLKNILKLNDLFKKSTPAQQ
ncbi:MAG: hypothetical protein QM492_02605 [Rhodobacterales bacterium]